MAQQSYFDAFIEHTEQHNPHQPEFIQAVTDIATDVVPIVNAHEEYKAHRVLYQLAVPDRLIAFKVIWEDDNGNVQINRGWRVQQSNVLGPYKGGLRFHPSVNESILKFLAFEQCFKNALTGLSLGGAKGGSDFNPKGRSDAEIMRFCKAFMSELYRHVGPQTDVPAGDINVGQREIGYLFGQYRRLSNEFVGTITGKDLAFGGSHVRLEATGYGVVFFLECMLAEQDQKLANMKVNVSGAGNVALFAAQKAIASGACVRTLSNSKGTLFVAQGLNASNIQTLLDNSAGENPLEQIASSGVGKWIEKQKPWQFECDVALPCATQNEVNKQDIEQLIDNGLRYLVEGANMPLTADAEELVRSSQVLYAPGKASNAGGVAMSGFEMGQNAQFHQLPFSQLEGKLKEVMMHIHKQCMSDGMPSSLNDKTIDYVRGANVAGFRRLADAIVAQGY
ncbi:NADP-specific glutamate dehydrogenase [Alteromonas flava]|uniref:NADP-specific glutamate dehydrogenase n=1 Tax=Alteromonas flava TaxID=2048003 RepID=UPI000C2842A5|nr:NADP-specific glutamate dehydrogenase [Alteromonas flava]